MMRLIYPICCGLVVHKNLIVATIVTTDSSGISEYNQKSFKTIKGKKTDKKDSRWIADLYKFDLVRCSFIPPEDFRQLCEIARYRFKLVCMKSSEKNRIQNCMTVSNIGIASVLSDPFCKTATEITT